MCTTLIVLLDHRCYRHHLTQCVPPPVFSTSPIIRPILMKLFTTECPTLHKDGTLLLQQDGIATGSPLGVTFANFYMCALENKILDENHLKHSIYYRCIDDIFVVTNNITQLQDLKTAFQDNSVLNLTHELAVNNSINFLDIIVYTNTDH